MNTYLNGFERKEVTFKASATLNEGQTAGFVSKTTMGPAILDEVFVGVCEKVRECYCSLVLKGYVKISYSGTAPLVGYNKMVADGNGGAKLSDDGRFILVADVDKSTLTCGIVL